MVALGLFEGERVELLYGVIVRMPPKGPPHDSAIQRLTKLLLPSLLVLLIGSCLAVYRGLLEQREKRSWAAGRRTHRRIGPHALPR